MLRHTSDNGFTDTISTDPVRGLLYDFDIEGYKLKKNQTDWLDTMVVEQIKDKPNRGWKVFVEGATSRTGSDKFDLDLSQRRSEEVAQYLRDHLAGVLPDFDTKWVGRAKAVAAGSKHSAEDRVDRAVQVVLQENTAPVPPPLPSWFQPAPPKPLIPPGFFWTQEPGETPEQRNRRIAQQIFRTIPPAKQSQTSILDQITETLTKTLDPIIKKLPPALQGAVREAIATGIEKGAQAAVDQALSDTKLSDQEKNAVRNVFQGLLKFKTQ
jgi:hypothetical protein